MTALQELISEIERGKVKSWIAVPTHVDIPTRKEAVRAFQGSIDAALRLKDALLPGWGKGGHLMTLYFFASLIALIISSHFSFVPIHDPIHLEFKFHDEPISTKSLKNQPKNQYVLMPYFPFEN